MSNKKHTEDLVNQQQDYLRKIEMLREDHEGLENKIDRYENLIRTQGAYLIAMSKLIRTGAKRKQMINYLNKYGIGIK